MPQAIRVIDPEARSAIYRPLMNDGRVVDDKGVPLEAGDSAGDDRRLMAAAADVEISPDASSSCKAAC